MNKFLTFLGKVKPFLELLTIGFIAYAFYQLGYSDCLSKTINSADGLYNFCAKIFMERIGK